MLHQSKEVKYGRTTPPVAYVAGMVAAAIFEHTIDGDDFTAATDILEIGILPAGAQIISAEIISGAMGAGVTATLSVMDGEAGAQDDNRAAVTDIQAAIPAHSVASKITTANALALAPAVNHRGLGLEFSADIAAGATKTIKMLVEYKY